MDIPNVYSQYCCQSCLNKVSEIFQSKSPFHTSECRSALVDHAHIFKSSLSLGESGMTMDTGFDY